MGLAVKLMDLIMFMDECTHSHLCSVMKQVVIAKETDITRESRGYKGIRKFDSTELQLLDYSHRSVY